MHIKDMKEEHEKAKMNEKHKAKNLIENYDRIYKPTYELEFNRTGELLVYSGTPFKHKTVFFQYPFILYESLIPISALMFLLNPMGVYWYFNYMHIPFMIGCAYPRIWYWFSLSYRIKKMWLLRGGKVVKVERTTLSGDTYTDWAEVRHFKPITENFQDFDDKNDAEFLSEKGQLNYELGVELDHFKHWGITEQDVNLFFVKEGIVHHPEVFEAICKGYHVDTTDFSINTSHDERALEPHHNL